MFDCPLATHTSPIRILLRLMVLSPVIVILWGVALAFIGLSSTFHLPSLVTVETLCPANSTVTLSPSRAVPQMGSSLPRWNTALSANRLFGLTSAETTEGNVNINRASSIEANSFILICAIPKFRKASPGIFFWVQKRR